VPQGLCNCKELKINSSYIHKKNPLQNYSE
jgi:hypothetical protein